MKNITLSIDDELLESGREYAKTQNVSFNALVQDLVRRTVGSNSPERIHETIESMRRAGGRSAGRKWRREDAYDA